jgi:prepilin-type N-terminal cleavage/methylation domain-containing protein
MKILLSDRRMRHGFTLLEVVLAVALGAIILSGMILGYAQAAFRAEWSAHSLAAQSLAMMRLEQVRSAKWDTLAYPPVDQVVEANFPARVEVLDLPVSGDGIVYATNFTSITSVSTTPPLKLIRVDCVWSFLDRGVYTNTISTYRAPDQ